MKCQQEKPSILILMASNYLYGVPPPEQRQKIWVEQDINQNIKKLRNANFNVTCKIPGGNMDEEENFTFKKEDWDKIYKFEFLHEAESRKIVKMDGNNFKLLNRKERS